MKTIKSSQGFTIIELVIAITILAMIVTTAYSGLMQILRARKSLDDERDLSMIANTIINRMTREFQLISSSSRILPPADDPSKIYPPFVHLIGTPNNISDGRSGDSVTFVADDAGQYVPDGQTHAGVVQITYRVEKLPAEENPDNEDIYYLVRDEIPVVKPNERAYKLRMTFPITKRLVELKFRYYDQEADSWYESWDDKKNSLPNLLHFALKIRSPLGKIQTYASDVPLKRGDLETTN